MTEATPKDRLKTPAMAPRRFKSPPRHHALSGRLGGTSEAPKAPREASRTEIERAGALGAAPTWAVCSNATPIGLDLFRSVLIGIGRLDRH